MQDKLSNKINNAYKMIYEADDNIKNLLQYDNGTTVASLKNAKIFVDNGWKLVSGIISKSPNTGGSEMATIWKKDDEEVGHKFIGFNLFYGGEGPRGLIEFLKMVGMTPDQEKITTHNPEFKDKTIDIDLSDLVLGKIEETYVPNYKRDMLHKELVSATNDGKLDTVKQLVNKGADPHFKNDEVYAYALQSGNIDVIKYFDSKKYKY